MQRQFSRSFQLEQSPIIGGWYPYGPVSFAVPDLSGEFSLSRRDGIWEVVHVDLGTGNFPPSTRGCFEGKRGIDNASPRISLSVEISLHFLNPASEPTKFPEPGLLAARSSAIFTEPPSSSVRLFFPRSGKTLWANESFLRQSSPYFEELLSSSFAEGSPSAKDVEAKQLDPHTFAESDDETDHLLPPAKEKDNSATLSPCKTITITDTAYSTYFAVLVYLQTGHIASGPLSSSFRFSSSDSPSSRSSVISSALSSSPNLPPPVSPKSTYRLVHLLSLPPLQSLALQNLVSQLTPANAAIELYSDTATCYAEERDKVLGFVVEKWEEVKASEGMKEVEEKARAGELDAAANETGLMLARALADKCSKA